MALADGVLGMQRAEALNDYCVAVVECDASYAVRLVAKQCSLGLDPSLGKASTRFLSLWRIPWRLMLQPTCLIVSSQPSAEMELYLERNAFSCALMPS